MEKIKRKFLDTTLETIPATNPAGLVVGDDLEEVADKISTALDSITGGAGGANVYIVDVQSTSGGVKETKTTPIAGTDIITAVAVENPSIKVIIEFDGSIDYLGDFTLETDNVAATPFTNYQQIGTDRRFQAEVDINVDGSDTYLKVVGEGAELQIPVSFMEGVSSVTGNVWGVYPNGQTELKSNDVIDLNLTFDESSGNYAEFKPLNLVVENNSAIAAGTYPLVYDSSNTAHVSLTIQTSHSDPVAALEAVPFYVENQYGSVVVSQNMPDLSLNEYAPTFDSFSVAYPASQGALKDVEQATVTLNINDADVVFYESPNGDLTVSNPNTLEINKTVTRLSGSYNVATTNFKVTATRNENKTVTIFEEVVRIANVIPVIDITIPGVSRLRSGGSLGTVVTPYSVVISSDQLLNVAPDISADIGSKNGSPVGDLATDLSFTQQLDIADTDSKGAGTFGINVITNLAGKDVLTINSGASYTVGGFVKRTVLITTPFGRLDAIGTPVVDTAKLVCTCLANDKTFVFKTSVVDEIEKFTITDNLGIYDVNGDYLYNLDEAVALLNSAGELPFELEEIE